MYPIIHFLPKSVVVKAYGNILLQQIDTGRHGPIFNPDGQSYTYIGGCEYCYYRNQWTNRATFNECAKKHHCYSGCFPFADMSRPINLALDDTVFDPSGSDINYRETGIFRQVMFEGMPLHVQMFSIKMVPETYHPKCNAQCWWHAWRLNNKKTWRQCGKTHGCGNDGSCWFLMAPQNSELYAVFLEQF